MNAKLLIVLACTMVCVSGQNIREVNDNSVIGVKKLLDFIMQNLILDNPDASRQMKIAAQRMLENKDQDVSSTLRFLADQSAKIASTSSTSRITNQREQNDQSMQGSQRLPNNMDSFRSTSGRVNSGLQKDQSAAYGQSQMDSSQNILKAIKLNTNANVQPKAIKSQTTDMELLQTVLQNLDRSDDSLRSSGQFLKGQQGGLKAIKKLDDGSLSTLQLLQNGMQSFNIEPQTKAIKAIKAIKSERPILTSVQSSGQTTFEDQGQDQEQGQEQESDFSELSQVSFGASSQPIEVQQAQPMEQQAQPLVQQAQSSYGQSQQVVQHQRPVVQQQRPVVQQQRPVVQQQRPVVQQQRPVVQQQRPVVQQQRPVVQQQAQSSYGQSQQVVQQRPVVFQQQVSKPVRVMQQSFSGATECLASQPIYEGDIITETYCRCSDGSYGFTCTEGYGNPCAYGDQQYYKADPRLPPRYFIHCSWNIPYLKKCSNPLVWDQDLLTCNWA